MKKIILTSLVATGVLFGLSDQEILSAYGINSDAAMHQNLKASIVKRDKIGVDDIDYVIIEFKTDKISKKEVLLTKGDLIYDEIYNVKEGKGYKKEISDKIAQEEFAQVYKNEDKKNIIKLGDDPKKDTLIILTDADCPYCRQEMKGIKDRLKTHNVEIIMSSVHGKVGHAKSYLIYKEMDKAKSDDEKISIFNKYYSDDIKIAKGDVSDENIAKMQNLSAKYQNAGISYVPFIIEKSSLNLK